MSKTICITALFILLTGFSCERIVFDTDVPDCVRRMARSLRNEEVRNPPAIISEWTLTTGEKYYYVPSYCCDMYGLLYDSDCNLVCAPDGGFTGNGDGQCPEEVLNNIESTKVIWEDDRGNNVD